MNTQPKQQLKFNGFGGGRGFRAPATVCRNKQARKQMEQVELEKIVKKDVPERFASWFGF